MKSLLMTTFISSCLTSVRPALRDLISKEARFFVSEIYVCIFLNCSQRQSWASKMRHVTPMLATSRRIRPLPWTLVCAATCHPCNFVIRPPNGDGGRVCSLFLELKLLKFTCFFRFSNPHHCSMSLVPKLTTSSCQSLHRGPVRTSFPGLGKQMPCREGCPQALS